MEDIRPEHALTPWLALALAKPLTPTQCRRLRVSFPDPVELHRVLTSLLGNDGSAARDAARALTAPAGPLSPEHVDGLRARATRQRMDAAVRWMNAAEHNHVVALDDPAYPVRLGETDDPPPVLYLQGSMQILEGPGVAIVGSRDVSESGRELTHEFSSALASAGLVIISGLALGTDACAHAAALRAGGLTLAYLATGIDRVYPRRHTKLAAAIVERGGALASEFPLGHTPKPWCFPQRNRLISGTSDAVLVIEAQLLSGTLTTARHALEQNRDVMAVPGPVRHPGSTGCHALIRDGATLIETADDVLLQMAGPLQRACAPDADSGAIRASKPATGGHTAPDSGSVHERHVWHCLAHDRLSVDAMAARTRLGVAPVMQALGILEITGHVVRGSDGRYARSQQG